MRTEIRHGDTTTLGEGCGTTPQRWKRASVDGGDRPSLELVEPFTVPLIAESAEAVIEELDAPAITAPALREVRGYACPDGSGTATGSTAPGPVAVDDYARAVLYNGLRHFRAALAAARRACARDDFALVEGALAELVEAAARSSDRSSAVVAWHRLEARARTGGSEWARGIAAYSRGLVLDDERAEDAYLESIDRLGATRARLALARAQLLYGEWLRRRGRRVDARAQLTPAYRAFDSVGLGGFAERAGRELMATSPTSRRRTDDTRFDLTAQESQIAEFAAGGWTNPEIGQRLFISPRTVEWHLRKVFTKLGVTSRRELASVLPPPPTSGHPA